MRFTTQDYENAIEKTRLGMTQIEPDGNECAICGDGGHKRWSAGFMYAEQLVRSLSETSA